MINKLKSTRTLKQTISQGIAFHHAGLLPAIKEIVEELFSEGKIKVLYKDEIIEEHDLLAFENIKKINIFSRLIKSISYLVWGDV